MEINMDYFSGSVVNRVCNFKYLQMTVPLEYLKMNRNELNKALRSKRSGWEGGKTSSSGSEQSQVNIINGNVHLSIIFQLKDWVAKKR